MAENLLRYGFSREDGQAVGNVLTEATNLINRQKNNLSEMKTFLQELKDIKGQVEKREQQFYRRFGASNYQQLNSKLQSIENDYSPLLASGKIVNIIRGRYDFTQVAGATTEEIASAVETAMEDFLTDERQQLIEETFHKIGYKGKGEQVIQDFIQKEFTIDEGSGRVITARNTASGREVVGLGKLIVGYDRKTKDKKGKARISAEGVHFSGDFKKRIEKALQNIIKPDGKKQSAFDLSKEEFRAEVNTLILENTQGEAQRYLQQVMVNKRDFDLNRSIASVTGYLGEIRAAALLKHLQIDETLARKYSAKGTGALRSNQTRQEIPIDIVCAGNGFQIKNYTLNDDKVTFSNTITAPTWIDKRMRLSGSIGDILISLFGIYQYNQPFIFSDERKDVNGLQEYIEMYNSIYENSNSLFYQMKDIFDARIPTMLKMYENFSVGGDNTFAVEQVYFNTFYWINSKLVPSSYILDQLIKQLDNKQESVIKSEYTLSSPIPGYSLQKKPLEVESGSMLKAAKKIKVTYDISIDLSGII